MFKCIWPVTSRRITSAYGPRKLGDGFHDGLDIGAKVQGVQGDQIVASHDGKVVFAATRGVYGNMIIIDDGEMNYSTLYGHLRSFAVTKGMEVSQGQLIGYMGMTGTSSGPHLHFEVRNKHYDFTYWNSHDGEFYSSYDPMKYLVEPATINESIDQAKKDNILTIFEAIEGDLKALKLLLDV